MAEINPNEGVPLKPSGVAAVPESKPAAAVKFDRTTLEANVAKGLAALQSDEDVADEDEADAEVEEQDEATEGDKKDDEKKDEDEEGEDDEETESDDEDEAEAAVEEAKPAKGKDSKTPTLPAAYRRSLKADGWEDEEIDGHYAKLGDAFLKTAAKIHKSRTDETARWAALGRQQRTQNPQQQQKPEPFQIIKPLDPAKLKEQYGDDVMVDHILGPINAVIAQINKVVPTIEATQKQAAAQESEQLFGQIESFFGSKDIANYAELYGKAGSSDFGQPHMEARNKVLELADALIAGAKAQGRQLGLNDALLVAHDSLSGDYKLKAARKEITTTLKKREKGLSLKPGNKVSKSVAASGAPATRTDLEKKVGKSLAAVFGK